MKCVAYGVGAAGLSAPRRATDGSVVGTVVSSSTRPRTGAKPAPLATISSTKGLAPDPTTACSSPIARLIRTTILNCYRRPNNFARVRRYPNPRTVAPRRLPWPERDSSSLLQGNRRLPPFRSRNTTPMRSSRAVRYFIIAGRPHTCRGGVIEARKAGCSLTKVDCCQHQIVCINVAT
jgi:hypothetical protein